MAAKQSMTQKIMQAIIMAVREADSLVNNVRPKHTTARLGGPELRQPMFAWKATAKYQELCNFKGKEHFYN